MGIREALNKNKKVAAGVTVSLLAAAGALGYYLSRSGDEVATTQEHVYFTVDDGKTWFVGNADQLYPFDHEGKTAYRVQLYKCGKDGQPVAVYLQRIADKALQEAQAAQAAGKKREEIEMIWEARLEVKAPGGSQWVPVRGRAGEAVTTPKCPPGTTPFIVLP
jgi:hypothetical protein